MWSGRALCLVLTLHHARVLAIAELPEDTNFVFDGTSSNLAQHFYNLHKAGISAQPLTFTGGLPSGVLARLDNYSLVFEKLPPMLQRALVWDTGYVLGDSNKLVRVRVNCSLTMADIAVSADDYNDLKKRYNCTTIPCAPAMEVNRAYVCYQQPMTTKSRCAITTTSVANQFTSTMWAMGGDAKAVPNPYVINHLWNDSGYSHRMMSIHTVAAETPWKLCPSDVGNAASMVIPCAPLKDKDGDGGYCRPNPGKLVDSWLVQFSAQNKNSGGSGASGSTTSTTSKSTGLTSGELIGIIVAGVLFVAVIALVVVRRRRMVMAQKDESADAVTTPNQGAAALQPQYSGENSVSAERKFSNKQTTSTASSQVESTGNHSDLLALLKSNPILDDRRIALDDIAFSSCIASGSYGEVWLARLHGVDVAIKKLLPTRQSTREISNFVAEIQLTATLDHPYIIRMIGVAWPNTDSLCLVLEYAARGDLQTYLHSHRDMLSWPRDMLPMVIGIAQALAYLHARNPAVIHRDLKSKNMLLNDQLRAKLIDFGVSRDKCDETMTAGVGTPYWTAPEVLDGRRYSEKSDIYSFGVFLSEVDTGTPPYSELKTEDGTKMSTIRVLQLVIAGQVAPTFSSECPARIHNIAIACLDSQPEKRPSAREIVDALVTGKQPDYMRL